MARKKAAAPQKRPAEDNSKPSSKRRKKGSSAGVVCRKIVKTAPKNVTLLGPLCLPWTVPEGFRPPTKLLVTQDDAEELQVTVDDVPLDVSPYTADLLRRYSHHLLIVFSSSTPSELRLNIGVKALPLSNARPIVETIYSKDYSMYLESEQVADTAWVQFFKALEEIQRTRQASSGQFQHVDLRPTLRGYQAAAVGWMMDREKSPGQLLLSWLPDVADTIHSLDGQDLLYNKFSQALYPAIGPTPTCSGGILADEMGLGKTVITLALVLNHKRTDLDEYAWQVVVKPDRLDDDDDDDNDDDGPSQRELNQEMCLDANERLQMVPTKPGRGILRNKLVAWYESKLAEMSVRRSSTQPRRRSFKCTCTKDPDRTAVTCTSCGLRQHPSCVGYKSHLPYVCPSCWREQSPVPSGATLIVAPPAIFQQWGSEVERHTPTLTVHLYTGVRENFVQPSYLAEFDVVITTYTVLRAETIYSADTSSRSLRNEGRYLRASSALERVGWWRVVCDEAQMVESDVSQPWGALPRGIYLWYVFSLWLSSPPDRLRWGLNHQVRIMTSKLWAEHRWCVTGTPIQRGIADLFYLTSFMGLGAFDDKTVWTDFLLKPYLAGCKEPLLSVLSQVFWRSTKEEVGDQLGLPDQTFLRHLLKFSAIEETFYMQQHGVSASKFAEGIYKSKVDVRLALDTFDKSTLNRLLLPLLNLRQACTHAQVVSGIKISSASGAANLAELLKYLCKKTKQECEEALRRHVADLNGLAGLHCLMLQWGEAVEMYRAVLRLAEECHEGVRVNNVQRAEERHEGVRVDNVQRAEERHEGVKMDNVQKAEERHEGVKMDGVKVDTLQRIHALTNAALVLEQNPGCAPPTLRDHRLMEDAQELAKKYLSKHEEAFSASRFQAETSSKEVKSLRDSFESSPDAWWVPVALSLKDFEKELVDKVAEELNSNELSEQEAVKYFLGRVTTLRGIEVTLKQWWTALDKHHKASTQAMAVLLQTPCSVLVEDALACHLRASEQRGKDKEKCQMCRVERSLQDLECELFATKRKNLKLRQKVIDGGVTKGSWQAHRAERTLTTLLSFARTRCALEAWCVRDGKLHARLLEAMKKEFKYVRASWTALNHRVHAEDELTMAKQRLRLAEPWETKHRPTILALSAPDNKSETVHLVPPGELPIMMTELTADREVSLSDFRKKQGRLLYLQNLGKDRNATPDPCPVCKSALEKQWCVLHCGHCFCIECLKMIHAGLAKHVKCPVCRELTEAADVGFVDTSGTGEVNDIPVTGDFSTKVDNIVREVLQLLREDATVKILIFSTWTEVLKILTQALTANAISSVALPSGKHQTILQKFRDADSGVSVLLLPLAWGSKGLNLVEASHVFLVEPILNPAEELQAIGRVHRIGQTRPTVVHRFIIKGTVEEKIFSVVSEAKDSWSNKTVTLADLQRLFVIPSR